MGKEGFEMTEQNDEVGMDDTLDVEADEVEDVGQETTTEGDAWPLKSREDAENEDPTVEQQADSFMEENEELREVIREGRRITERIIEKHGDIKETKSILKLQNAELEELENQRTEHDMASHQSTGPLIE
mgnify:CR=1 FL=1